MADMTARTGASPDAPIDSVEVSVYRVPTDGPEADGTATWDHTTVVAVVVGAAGESGLGWTYSNAAVAQVVSGTLAPLLDGKDALDLEALHEQMLRELRNAGVPGMGMAAVSAVDIALWDLRGKVLDQPVSSLLGRVHRELPIYGSGGFTTYDEKRMREQARYWVDDLGARAVKIKIGESWGSNVERDLERVGLVRQEIGTDVDLMVDANGGYGVGQAIRVERAMQDHEVVWFEEPVSSRDLRGLAEVRRQSLADIAAGEYGSPLSDFRDLLTAGAVDVLQADVTRCGGFTGWRRVATLAAVWEREISAHCAPALTTHVGGVATTLKHLEYFYDHGRLEPMLFDGVPVPQGGMLAPSEAPGHGMSIRADAGRWRVM